MRARNCRKKRGKKEKGVSTSVATEKPADLANVADYAKKGRERRKAAGRVGERTSIPPVGVSFSGGKSADGIKVPAERGLGPGTASRISQWKRRRSPENK